MNKNKPIAQNISEEAQTILERTKAKAHEAKGVLKEAIGKATNNTKLTAEGKIDQVAGKVMDAAARTKDAARDAAENIQKELHNKH